MHSDIYYGQDLSLTGNPVFAAKKTPVYSPYVTHEEPPQEDADQEEIVDILARLNRCSSAMPARRHRAAINAGCACRASDGYLRKEKEKKQGRRKGSDSKEAEEEGDDEDKSDSEEEEEEEESFSLVQLLKAFSLYEKKPEGKRSATVIRNLVASFKGVEAEQEDTLMKVLLLLDSPDTSLREMSIHTVGKLATSEDNTRVMLDNDVFTKLVYFLELDTYKHLQEPAAYALEKILSQKKCMFQWQACLQQGGFLSLVNHLGRSHPLPVRQACATALRTLSQYPEYTQPVIKHVMPVIGEFKTMNTNFQELYTGILTNLLVHADDEACALLNVDALPAAVYMLEQGPCGAQKQALCLLTTLSHTDAGLSAMLHHHSLLPYVLSAMIDSQCRKVREKAIHCLSSILATKSSNLQKSILDQTFEFFHHLDDKDDSGYLDQLAEEDKPAPTMPPPPPRAATPSDEKGKLQRAIGNLGKSFCKMLHRDGRMEVSDKGRVLHVALAPTIDVDPIMLSTLSHTVQAVGNLLKFSVNKVKAKMEAEPDGVDKNQWKEIKKKYHSVNYNIAKQMLSCGVLCMLDLLHVYTTKLEQCTEAVQSLFAKSGSKKKRKPIRQAWTSSQQSNSPVVKPGSMDVSSVFEDNELQLVCSILETISLFTSCACREIHTHLHDIVTSKIKSHTESEHNEEKIVPKVLPSRKFICIHCGRRLEVPIADLQKKETSMQKSSICAKCEKKKMAAVTKMVERASQDVRRMEERYRESLAKELGAIHRHLRLGLLQGGVVEAVGFWLTADHWMLQSLVLEILVHLVQPLMEKVRPAPPQVLPHRPLLRPASAMTSKERDHALNLAMSKMSTKMRDFIKDALGPDAMGLDEKKPIVGGVKREVPCRHQDRPLSRQSLAPVMEAGELSREQVDAEYDAIVEDLEDDDHPIDLIDVGRELSVGSGDAIHANSNGRVTSGKSRPGSAAMYERPDYENFARSRPSSGVGRLSRQNSTADRSSRPPRPTSGKLSEPDKNELCNGDNKPYENGYHVPNGEGDSSEDKSISLVNREDDSTALWQASLRPGIKANSRKISTSSTSSMRSSSPNSTTRTPRNKQLKTKATRKISKTENCNQNGVSRNGEVIRNGTSMENKIEKAVSRIKKAPVMPWKSHVELWRPIAEQCRERIVDVIGPMMVSNLYSKSESAKMDLLDFLHQYVAHAQSHDNMKMSQIGIMPKMVDFLRVNDEHELLAMMSLCIVEGLCISDGRLKDLFQQSGGTQLLIAMAGYTKGALRTQVGESLQTINNHTASVAPRPKPQRAQSAPVQRVTPLLPDNDVWRQIQQRWEREDKVQNLLQKFS